MRNPLRRFLFALLFAGTCQAQGTIAAENPPRRLDPGMVDAARSGAPFRVFSAWVEALNSSESARLPEFMERHYPGVQRDGFSRLQYNSNGLELRALDEATDTHVAGLVQERDSDNFLRFDLTLEPGDPDKIRSLEILYIPRPADFPPPRMTTTEIFAALDAKLVAAAVADRFSGVVLVTRHGKVVYSAVHGLADRGAHEPNTLETRFNIGSMNKMFTATAIMQLVQKRRIRLSDPVGKYLPDYPNKDIASKVTIEHLLTHTGGTGNIFGPEYSEHRLELRTHADYVKLFGTRPPAFEPGSRFEYSNFGPVLLGLVIENVTRQSYFDYVRRHVYKPAKMIRTGSEPIDELLPNTAIGYMRSPDGGRKPNTETLSYRATAAGGGYSTAGDLARFADALLGNELLNADNTRTMLTGKTEAVRGMRYAYGFEDLRHEGAGSVGHGGAAPGVNSTLLMLPASGYVVVVLTNIDPPFGGRIGSWITLRLENQR